MKDLKYEVKMTENSAVLVTEPITGYIEAFIIMVNKPINFDATLDDYSEANIWSEVNLRGSHFLPIRIEGRKNSESKYTYQYEKIPLLDNKISFNFRGIKNTEIKLIVRYSDA